MTRGACHSGVARWLGILIYPLVHTAVYAPHPYGLPLQGQPAAVQNRFAIRTLLCGVGSKEFKTSSTATVPGLPQSPKRVATVLSATAQRP